MMRALRIAAAACVTVATIVICTTALSLLFILTGFNGNAEFPVDCGIVFGAAISGRNTAGPAIVRRVAGAAELWKDGRVNKLILTGGKGDSWRLSEAAVMRQEAIRHDIDGRDILIEESARSTKENLSKSRFIIESECESVVAISDQYHMARIRLLAKKAGWGSLPAYGVPDRPEQGESRSVLRELAAYMYYALGADNVFELDEYDDGPATGSGGQMP